MKIGGLDITPGIMNAACSVVKSLDDVRALAKTPIGAIVIGSITVQPRQGNPEPRWYDGKNYALNSFGMPNGGAAFYEKVLPSMVQITHKANKKLIVSIAGFSIGEYIALGKLADASGVDCIELNLGCPNITISDQQKPIASFDPRFMMEIITGISAVTAKPLWLKLSPYSNPAQIKTVAKMITDSKKVAAVVTSNTFANGFMIENKNPVVGSEYGGLSGKALLPIALGQVRQFRAQLPKEIAVIGVGGIESAQDVALYKQAGASGVQAATLIVRHGHSAIERLVS